MRALHAPTFLRAGQKGILNRAVPLNCGCADLHRFGIVKSNLPRHSQLPGVALIASAGCPTVALITKHIAHRLGGQRVRLSGAAHS